MTEYGDGTDNYDGPIRPWREPLPPPSTPWQPWEIMIVILCLIGLMIMGCGPLALVLVMS
jgi:hypothetical protein